LTTTSHQQFHHEESDVNVRAILAFGAGLFAVMVVVAFVVWLFFRFMNGPRPEPVRDSMTEGQELRLPPEPQLQRTPREDLRAFRVGEDELLNRYEWVDRDAGVVRIPIAEAMKLTVQRGLPARSEPVEKK
jgi:hypothetical protein